MKSSELIRQARDLAGLSQTQLAARAHVTQSVVSDYERGRREPSFATLNRLVEATGAQLEIAIVPRQAHMLDKVVELAPEIVSLTNKYGYSNPRVFGSVARREDGPASDLDLLVSGHRSIFDLAGLKDELEQLLHVEVDVAPEHSLKPHVEKNALAEAVPL
ncbi:MAG: helix-turn-helix domain-containing protein [Propionibacteriaceae bacterium]|jgi:predicted nucleotidyltransferase/DNA-binding XRE family transcriptional regulator|nr:helix-turn-helix domain-containing protein [Propionibacteriaceae bacterium]